MSSEPLTPVADPCALFNARQTEMEAAVRGVLASGRFVLGEQMATFETELAAYLGVAHCIGVASGTDALRLALMGADIGPGTSVVTSTHTSVATLSAIGQTGARPFHATMSDAAVTRVKQVMMDWCQREA